MANAAFTIVQNDMLILGLWLRYYSQYFEQMTVIGNGTKAEYKGQINDWQAKYQLSFEQVGFLGNSDQTVVLCREKQKQLLANHEWVLYSDCDEYVVADPAFYKDLRTFMQAFPKDKTCCEGFNVLQAEDEEPIDFNLPYLSQRKYWAKDVDYNKPLLSRTPLNWAPGCHRELEEPDTDGKKLINTGLFLLHLKYADLHPKGKRDFGPTITQLNHGKVAEGMKIRQEIPKEIRRLF